MDLKKVFSAVIAAAVIGGAQVAPNRPSVDLAMTAAAEDTYGPLTYSIGSGYSGNYICIDGCDKSATEIEIPAEIGGVPVTTIGYNAFYRCAALTSVTIPDSVEDIATGAFAECSSLTSINFPDGVTVIGVCAFAGCTSLTSITIPDSVTGIGGEAFSLCGLTSVVIPESVTSIQYDTFRLCKNLTEITILNPDCEIFGDSETISTGYDDDGNIYYDGTIYGWSGSTAQAYAEKYGYSFVALDDDPPVDGSSLGDVNGDGLVDSVDAALILVHNAGVAGGEESTLDSGQLAAADVNGDGLIDSVDAATILAYNAYIADGGSGTVFEFLEII